MNKRILYIEDNDQNYYLVHFILTKLGYEVIRARDGREWTGRGKLPKVLNDLIKLTDMTSRSDTAGSRGQLSVRSSLRLISSVLDLLLHLVHGGLSLMVHLDLPGLQIDVHARYAGQGPQCVLHVLCAATALHALDDQDSFSHCPRN